MFLNISLNLALSISVVSLLISVVLYFIIFRKYNKRNGLSVIDKLCNCGEFSTKTALHVFMIVLGLDYFIEGMLLIESVYERYANYVVAVIVISLTIFHYIKYFKKLFIDRVAEEVKENEKRTERFAEYILFIFLGAMIITPIFYIPRAAAICSTAGQFFTEIIKAIGCMLTGGYLMVYMNPLGAVRSKDVKTIFDTVVEEEEIVEKEAVVENEVKKENTEENKEVKEEKKETKKNTSKKKTTNSSKSSNNKGKNNSKSNTKNTKNSSSKKKSSKSTTKKSTEKKK